MTELTIRPEEIRDAIEKSVASYSPQTSREEVGRVIETGQSAARVLMLTDAASRVPVINRRTAAPSQPIVRVAGRGGGTGVFFVA